jgi:hypothetical protein
MTDDFLERHRRYTESFQPVNKKARNEASLGWAFIGFLLCIPLGIALYVISLILSLPFA